MIQKRIKHILLGQPLATKALEEERLNNFQALAIFGSDAISSATYATEEILLGLTIAGTVLFSSSLPIALAISSLIIIVALSYKEILHAYPQGGGVYNVAKKNLGELAGLTGASSLVTDYILTVAVSITAGVAAITSALPQLFPYRIILGIGVIMFLTWMNLRGVRSAGKIFSWPTYFFIASMLIMLATGLFRFFNGTLPVVSPKEIIAGPVGLLGIIMILRAFSSGCAALTGIEAISNGIRVFKSPESKNASKTLFRLSFLLILIFLGITFLAYQMQVAPIKEETVVSQIARMLFGKTFFYFVFQMATFLILFLAANTAYADFPRVVALLAGDGYLPRQFFVLGSRLVFSRGIITLSVISSFLIFAFGGSVHSLIPLYAVGVFLGFSLSQLGMLFHWKTEGAEKHIKSIIINATGFVVTSIVFVVVFLSKLLYGAWILLPTIFLFILVMKKINHHYVKTNEALKIEMVEPQKTSLEKIIMVILVSKIDRRSIEATRFAETFHPAEIKALHIAFDKQAGQKLKKEWKEIFPNIPIEVYVDEFRETIIYILEYFTALEKKREGQIVAVIPMMITVNSVAEYLHNQIARKIVAAIREDDRNNVKILEAPIKI